MRRAETKQNIGALIAFVVVSFTVTGYFVGLQAPMTSTLVPEHRMEKEHALVTDSESIRATDYSEMPSATQLRASKWQTSLTELKSHVDPMAPITVTPAEKLAALENRERNRAFNGAPPTIPHPVDQKSTAACIACHGEGAKTESLRIPKMSHRFLANCTQCHVESNPKHMKAETFRENQFAGMTAPTAGPRAFVGAPPQIPHSTWMRSECLSCHGFAGQKGIRTTHPWRQNCLQCHTPSAILEQTLIAAEPQFLPPPKLTD